MLNALKLESIRKGYDPRDFTLVAFGGGGPMHAPILAKELGVKKVIIPTEASVFSAWGMLMTDLRRDFIQTYVRRFGQIDLEEINNNWQAIEVEATQQYEADGMDKASILFVRYADMRYVGQEHTVKVQVPNREWDLESIAAAIDKFHQLHEKAYTFKFEQTEVEVVSLHVIAFGKVDKPPLKKLEQDRVNFGNSDYRAAGSLLRKRRLGDDDGL